MLAKRTVHNPILRSVRKAAGTGTLAQVRKKIASRGLKKKTLENAIVWARKR